jgi:hypothetical protein
MNRRSQIMAPREFDFSVGDKIRLIEEVSDRAVRGHEGVVIEIRNDGHLPYVVRVDGKGQFPVARKWIEAA